MPRIVLDCDVNALRASEFAGADVPVVAGSAASLGGERHGGIGEPQAGGGVHGAGSLLR